MLKLIGITKVFGEKTVLNNINIEIEDGEVYGLVGANGAGKTTLMNIISQLLVATSGTVEIDGKEIHNLNDLSGQIGYMLDIPPMHDFLTAYEYFEYLSAAQKLTKEQLILRADELLKKVGLFDLGNKRIKNFSRGMRQRLGIAAGLITNPKIVLMDEPSSALDPQGRVEVIEIIKSLASEGKTIILSTHILSDVEKVCSRVGLLVSGDIVTTGTLDEVLARFQENIYKIDCKNENSDDIIKKLKKISVCETAYKVHGGVCINFKEGKQKEMFDAIKNLDADFYGATLKLSTIEEIFLKAQNAKNQMGKTQFINELVEKNKIEHVEISETKNKESNKSIKTTAKSKNIIADKKEN